MANEPLTVIGIGQDGPAGLSAEARDHVAQAKVLVGGHRNLAFFPEFAGRKIIIEADIPAVISQLRECYRRKKTVIVASGDPLFFGIGAALVEAIPRKDLQFIPHLSSVQLAFARIREPWHDAQIVSLHGRPLESLGNLLADRPRKLALLTDGRNHPAHIADYLATRGYGNRATFWVAEELGGPGERVTSWTAESIRGQEFSPLNVLIVLRNDTADEPFAKKQPLIGIPDDAIAHLGMRRGMITKREVRLISLAALELQRGDVLWDIGAGSGSVSIEAARLSPELRVFAVERVKDVSEILRANVRRFALFNIDVTDGEAPDVFDRLPDPSAVFIGGSGGRLAEIVAHAAQRLAAGGRMVMNCITVENFSQGWNSFREAGLNPSATVVQLSHTKPLANLHAFEPEAPIQVLRGTKP